MSFTLEKARSCALSPSFCEKILLRSAPERLQARLTALSNHRAQVEGQQAHFQAQEKGTRQRLLDVPLIHGVTKEGIALEILDATKLVCKQQLSQDGSTAQRVLGTDHFVCTSAGILYPNRSIAFVFGATCEAGREAEATPFDSGHFHKQIKKGGADDRAEALLRYSNATLPAPEYREYLVCYVASCFLSADAWLKQEMHCYPDPEGYMNEQLLSRVFEVRFRHDLPLDTHLKAVFFPYDSGDLDAIKLKQRLSILESRGVELYAYSRSKEIAVGSRVRQWITDHRAIPERRL